MLLVFPQTRVWDPEGFTASAGQLPGGKKPAVLIKLPADCFPTYSFHLSNVREWWKMPKGDAKIPCVNLGIFSGWKLNSTPPYFHYICCHALLVLFHFCCTLSSFSIHLSFCWIDYTPFYNQCWFSLPILCPRRRRSGSQFGRPSWLSNMVLPSRQPICSSVWLTLSSLTQIFPLES